MWWVLKVCTVMCYEAMDEGHSFSVAGRKKLAFPAKVELVASSFHLVLEQTRRPLSCSFKFALSKELFKHMHTPPPPPPPHTHAHTHTRTHPRTHTHITRNKHFIWGGEMGEGCVWVMCRIYVKWWSPQSFHKPNLTRTTTHIRNISSWEYVELRERSHTHISCVPTSDQPCQIITCDLHTYSDVCTK